MPHDPLTLTRQDLYELVWSKPMSELARDVGISDVALAKRCRKLGIPVPGRGYWARVSAGQSPRRPPLKAREKRPLDHSALAFHTPREPEPENRRTATPPEQSGLRERIATLPLPVATDHKPHCPAIKRTALLKNRPWKKELAWNRGEKSGPVVRVETSDLVIDRALRIADTFLMAADSLGWKFGNPPESENRSRHTRPSIFPFEGPIYGILSVQGEALSFRIDERRRQIDHVLTAEEKATLRRWPQSFTPRWDLVPCGELRLHLMHADADHTFRTWKDTPKRPLEQQLHAILRGFLDEALQIKTRREERRRSEEEHRRQEAIRYRQSQRRAANTKLVHELETQSGAWYRARILRTYLRALRRATGAHRPPTSLGGMSVDFLSWAEHYVDQLDPLSPTPHDEDLKDESIRQYNEGDAVAQTIGRLLGRYWQSSTKFLDQNDAVRNAGE